MRALVLAAFALGCSDATPAASPPADRPCEVGESPMMCRRHLAIAHRGGARLAPEETLAAYARASDLGVDMLETDVHATADGIVVCIHDDTVDRTTDGKGKVSSFTFEALRKLDAGYAFTPDGGKTFPFRGKGVVVASLEEVLRAHPDKLWSIEIKQVTPSIVDATLAAIDAARVAERVVVASFYDDVLASVRAKRPSLATTLGIAEMSRFSALDDDTEKAYAPPGRIFQAPFESVTPEVVARAERLGMRVQAWTPNERRDVDVLIGTRVHGIMSDDPGMLLAAYAEAGVR